MVSQGTAPTRRSVFPNRIIFFRVSTCGILHHVIIQAISVHTFDLLNLKTYNPTTSEELRRELLNLVLARGDAERPKGPIGFDLPHLHNSLTSY